MYQNDVNRHFAVKRSFEITRNATALNYHFQDQQTKLLHESIKISTVILAGGKATRMGGSDKGLLILKGQPLIAWVLDHIRHQSEEIFISANRNLEQYGYYGYPVISDKIEGFQGPLAGLHSAMLAAHHDLILAVPCDTPFLPEDLVTRLYEALIGENAQIALPSAGGRTHHAIMLCRRELASDLAAYLASGERKVMAWQAKHTHAIVPFDDATAFNNFNTPEDLSNF